MDRTIKILLQFIAETTGIREAVSAVEALRTEVTTHLAPGIVGAVHIATRQTGFLGDAFRKTQVAVSKAIGGIKNLLTDLAQHAKWASFFIGTVLVGVGTAALKMASDFEKTVVGFKYLIGNAEEASKTLEDLQKLAIETVFPTDKVIEFGKRLYSSGIEAKDLTKTLRALMAVTLGTGGGVYELNRIIRAYSQIAMMGKVRTQELWQMVNAGVPVYRTLAQAIKDGRLKVEGLSKGTFVLTGANKKLTRAFQKQSKQLPILEKRLEAARKRLEELKEKGKEGTSTFLRAEATMMNYANRVQAAKDTIAAYNVAQSKQGKVVRTAGASLEEIMGKLMNVGKLNIKGAEAARILAEDWNKTYGGIIPETTRTVSGQFDMLKDRAQILARNLLGVTTEGRRTGSVMDYLYKILEKTNNIMADLNENNFFTNLPARIVLFAGLGIAIGALSGFILGILAPVAKAAILFGALGAALGGLFELYQRNRTVFSAIAGALGAIAAIIAATQLPLLIAAIGAKFAGLIGTISGLLNPITALIIIVGILAGVIVANWDTIKAALEGFVESFNARIEELKKGWEGFWNTIVIFGRLIENFFVAVLPQLVSGGLQALWGAILSFGQSLLAFLVNLPKMIFNFFMKAFYFIPIEMAGMWVGFWTEFLPQATQMFLTWMGTLLENFIMWWIEFHDTAYNWMINTATAIFNEVSTWPGRFSTWLGLVLLKVTEWLGRQYQAIEAGITKQIKMIKDEVSTWPEKFENWLESIPDIIGNILENAWNTWVENLNKTLNFVSKWKDKIIGFFNSVKEAIEGMIRKAEEAFTRGFLRMTFQHGGIVPGTYGMPVPIIAHAGERVVPRTGADTGYTRPTVNINISGTFTIDDPARLRELANLIGRTLGRQMELAQLGAGW
ncbi:MAG: tape measure protein [Candidatus Heimdallarchaeota archaeon]